MKCENCGLEDVDLITLTKPGSMYEFWDICKHCCGALYMHEFYPHDTWKDICRECGKAFHHAIHC